MTELTVINNLKQKGQADTENKQIVSRN